MGWVGKRKKRLVEKKLRIEKGKPYTKEERERLKKEAIKERLRKTLAYAIAKTIYNPSFHDPSYWKTGPFPEISALHKAFHIRKRLTC